jgi:hypothetical protein
MLIECKDSGDLRAGGILHISPIVTSRSDKNRNHHSTFQFCYQSCQRLMTIVQ